MRARSSFGPEGHRGMSVLIFDTSAVGYLEAERLSKEFEHEGLGRDAWDHYPNVFHLEGNKRQLYGFMATKEDLEIFNQYSHGMQLTIYTCSFSWTYKNCNFLMSITSKGGRDMD